jgi:hypothetical protein
VFGFGGIRRTVGAALVGACVALALLAVPPSVADAAPSCSGFPAVSVEGGGTWTRTTLVNLRITAPPGASAVEIANSPDFADAQRRPLSDWCTYGWMLAPASPGPERIVYVRFPGAADPAAVSATRVWLDDEEPIIVRADARWRNHRKGWVLKVRAIDLGSGAAWFQTARRSGKVRRSWPQQRTVVSWDRSTIEKVRYFDRVGNHTGWVRVRFLR